MGSLEGLSRDQTIVIDVFRVIEYIHTQYRVQISSFTLFKSPFSLASQIGANYWMPNLHAIEFEAFFEALYAFIVKCKRRSY